MDGSQEPGIVLFDGVCSFCNSSVNFILHADRRGVFRFAALQSPEGRNVLRQVGMGDKQLDSLALVEGERVWVKSTAALRIARRLPVLWKLVSVLLVIPRPIRDWCYDAFAARRYRWFGRQDACLIPTPEMRSRFLQAQTGSADIAASARSN